MRFGNMYADAMTASAMHGGANLAKYNARQQPLAKGWQFIGSGHSRHAYLSPSNVVYKVGWGEVNEGEHKAASILRNINHPLIGIPKTHYYPTIQVLAMEYIDGDLGLPQKNKAKYEAALEVFKVLDRWYMNYIFDGAKLWLIDLGEFHNNSSLRALEAHVKDYNAEHAKP